MPVGEDERLYTVGELARRVGVAARTVRFWSDAGVLPPSGRSAGGYRLYDSRAVARCDLVKTLRDLGLGLDAVRDVLARRATIAQVADAHVKALDAEIRALRLRRAVLSTVAARGGTAKEMVLMNELARLSVRERRQIIDDFVTRVTEGVGLSPDAIVIADWMREMPDDPSPERVDAWIELAGLVADEDFQRKIRQMVVTGSGDGWAPEWRPGLYPAVVTLAGRALADGITPESSQGKTVLNEIVSPYLPASERVELRERLELLADARVERYWQLLELLNGGTSSPSAIPAFQWLIAALHAHC
ncbi:MerR family transcriptional regulator [Sphaerisporangium siamense]|uniref:DNA-binding transcriptional MerR regulator n=1 Tax=Sphaerisporangium siamense TaxID=795645 RepID=A0A7W7DI07_9ACTN|nr:MerR family transcriptional regulator [Sphaerisporangium siamense]MBB4705678.1 DNA-binding transcriptional MerR regulator [Sphaerisporangium siamense]GII82936.1 MerR family transcriptional regulator [Sphaerisporangium siamense]